MEDGLVVSLRGGGGRVGARGWFAVGCAGGDLGDLGGESGEVEEGADADGADVFEDGDGEEELGFEGDEGREVEAADLGLEGEGGDVRLGEPGDG